MSRYPQVIVFGMAALLSGAAFAADGSALPPCEPGKPVPAAGCMAPKDPPNNPLNKLQPAPPLTVPSGPDTPKSAPVVPGAPPSQAAPTTPGTIPVPSPGDSSSVIPPPRTGDHDIAKPAAPVDPNMPVVKPEKQIKS